MLPIINMVFVSHDAVHALNANIDTLVLRLLDETTAFHLTIKEHKCSPHSRFRDILIASIFVSLR